ncbi:hypothetical protein NQ318_001236 [Aromia moschata]|uniref:Uncharacterized protein n=1 Tax=Aromia moschata TaxID=1265417 RepID=A0AAV8ZGJ3_9CUCU|nr:hypothetical protein NQ318_001236 [Aromia moschata]
MGDVKSNRKYLSNAFTWSLHSHEEEKSTQKEESKGEIDENINYYPNCDVSVWLRSCKEEIIEPIDGKIIGNVLISK